LTREQAEAALEEVLSDEPAWADILRVVRVDLSGSESVAPV